MESDPMLTSSASYNDPGITLYLGLVMKNENTRKKKIVPQGETSAFMLLILRQNREEKIRLLSSLCRNRVSKKQAFAPEISSQLPQTNSKEEISSKMKEQRYRIHPL